MEDKDSAPQRIITISIAGVKKQSRVFYSYVSPIYGSVYMNAPQCDISVDQPTYTMFVLDFAASMNGWTFKGIEPRNDPKHLKVVLAENKLSITTYNPYDADYPNHKYYIVYHNLITNAEVKFDPQEGNVPPPG